MTEPPNIPQPHQTPRTPEELRTARLRAKENAAYGKIIMICSGIGIPVGLIGWWITHEALWILAPLGFFGLGLAAFIYGKIMEDTYKDF